MMEGLFVWFEGDVFLESKLKWIWRGEMNELNIHEFQNNLLQKFLLDIPYSIR